MKLIEHEPDEKRPDNRIFWIAGAILALIWFGHLAFFDLDWRSVVLGAATGFFVTAWGIEVSGNKLPDWWR